MRKASSLLAAQEHFNTIWWSVPWGASLQPANHFDFVSLFLFFAVSSPHPYLKHIRSTGVPYWKCSSEPELIIFIKSILFLNLTGIDSICHSSVGCFILKFSQSQECATSKKSNFWSHHILMSLLKMTLTLWRLLCTFLFCSIWSLLLHCRNCKCGKIEQSDKYEHVHVLLVSLSVRQVQFRHSSYEQ